jgi:tetratricopeptide (TPR) repeat protein
MLNRVHRHGRSLAGIGALLLGTASATAFASDGVDEGEANKLLSQSDAELAKVQADIQDVGRGYSEKLEKASHHSLEQRFREGEILFLLNDYLRASVNLLDIVEDPANKASPRYDDALYFLAQSLAKIQNYSGARQYFEELLPRANGERLKDVVLALLELASTTGRFEHVEDYIGRLRSSGGLSRPDVDYIQAKMTFRGAAGAKDKLERAYQMFHGIQPGAKVSAQASYYGGVVLVSLGRYPEALTEFMEADNRAEGAEQAPIRELARLSTARLYQELGQTEKAVEAYQTIAKGSANFSEALFELAWAHVKAANAIPEGPDHDKRLRQALEMADLLMATAPDVKLFPEARILQGNLQIRLEAPEAAYETFQAIIDRYGGARSKLAELISTTPDTKQFFDQLIAADQKTAGSSTGFLPPLVVEWAIRSDEMKRAVAVMEDLKQSDNNYSESHELIETLTKALASEQRYNMFNGLSKVRAKAFGAQNKLTLITQRLANLERRMLTPFVTGPDANAIQIASGRRSVLEGEIAALPGDDASVEASRQKISAAFRDIDRNVFRQIVEIGANRNQIVAVEVWLGQNREQMAPPQVESMKNRLAEARQELDKVNDAAQQLAADIRSAAAVSRNDPGRTHGAAIRAEYTKALEAELTTLRGLRSRLPGPLQAIATHCDQIRDQVAKNNEQLNQLEGQLQVAVDTQVVELGQRLGVERDRLEGYGGEKSQLHGETDRSLGPFAAGTLRQVAEEMKSLVLRADVGIIDVAWARKQESTKKVGEQVKGLQDRTRELETEFADVLEGN